MRKLLRKMRAMPLLLLLGICFMAVLEAEAQVAPNIQTPTNFPPTLAGAAGTNVASFIPIYAGRGLGLAHKFNAVSGTANSIMALSFSVDGTNAGTKFFTWTNAATTTTDVVATTNWSAAQLSGYRALYIGWWTNEAASGTPIMTNKLILYNNLP